MEQALCFFADRPRAGKDHLASVLMELGFFRVAFADALYEEAAAAFGVTVSYLQEGPNKETPQGCLTADLCQDPEFALLLKQRNRAGPLSPREVLQTWGTEHRRAQSESYWVDRVRDTLRKAKPERLVFTDARFLNEFKYAEQLGCMFWKIVPAGFESFMPSSGGTHASNAVGQWWVPDLLLLNVFGTTAAEEVLRKEVGNFSM